MWRNVAIVYKNDDKSAAMAQEIAEVLREHRLEIWLECSKRGQCPTPNFTPDLIISIGGDGTLLYAARAWGLTGIPLLGVNMGSMGFLAETEPDQFFELLQNVLAGNYQAEKRMALEVTVERQGHPVANILALNEIVINKGGLSRIITLNFFIKDFGQWSFRADGVIISTPTGSTAYNLSSGGPVVYPTIPAIIITPICPFSLTSRPLIIPPTLPVEVKIDAHDQDIHLTADGQVSITLEPGDRITTKNHEVDINFIVNPKRNFIDILRRKLNWA